VNIIVEGVDCAGKSTLVKEIKNRLKYDVLALGHRAGDDQFRRYLRAYADHERMVYERSHISEVVYSVLYGREQPFSQSRRSLLDQIAAETSLVIFADPDVDIAKERYLARQGVYQQIQLDQLETCIGLFRDYRKAYKWNSVVYKSRDWAELEAIVDKVGEYIDTHGA
jgi:thymidylate kinase